MKLKIEFDTSTNNSFDQFSMSEEEIVCKVLDHIKEQMLGMNLDTYNLIRKDGYCAIGMFIVEK